MVEATTVVRALGGVALLFANGFFVTTEFAMTRVRQFSQEAFTGHRGLERAWEMSEELEIYLSGCQLGITIASVGLGVVAEPAVAALIDPLVKAAGLGGLLGGGGQGGHTVLAIALALTVINLAHVIVGEQAPTYLGVERSRQVCKYCAPVLYYWTKVMSPIIVVADRAAKGLLSLLGVTITRSWADEEAEGDAPSRAEARRQMGDRLRGLGLSEDRREEVLAALDIEHVPIEDVMIPREDAVMLSTTDSFAENRERMSEGNFARFPLVEESLDEFVGPVYLPAVLRDLDELEGGERSLTDITSEPVVVDAEMPVADFIDHLQHEQEELAVVERDDDAVGIVTATDALEVITGDIQDPLDGEDDGETENY